MERITHDLFRIADRIKEIDINYAIYRNYEKDRYEVWWRGGFAFVVPFQFLDERLLNYVRETRRERSQEIENEIDEANAQVAKDQQRNIAMMKAKIKDYVNYDFERFN